MYDITMLEFTNKLKENEIDVEGEMLSPPNGIIKEKGKPDLIWIYYNNRRYTWLLVL